eukprot:366039-Chlamydomonas_euryale.AAC.6
MRAAAVESWLAGPAEELHVATSRPYHLELSRSASHNASCNADGGASNRHIRSVLLQSLYSLHSATLCMLRCAHFADYLGKLELIDRNAP